MSERDDVPQSETDTVQQWLQCERTLLGKILGTLDHYERFNGRIILAQRIVSVSIMIGGAIAPVLVAGAGSKEGLFGIEAERLSSIAIVLTITLAVLEGLRRIFRFEQRWISRNSAKVAIEGALDDFNRRRIGVLVGSETYVAAYTDLWNSYRQATMKETEVFYEGLRALQPVDEKGRAAK